MQKVRCPVCHRMCRLKKNGELGWHLADEYICNGYALEDTNPSLNTCV